MSRASRLGAAVLAILSCVALAAPAAAGDKHGAPPEFVVLHDLDPTIRYDIRWTLRCECVSALLRRRGGDPGHHERRHCDD